MVKTPFRLSPAGARFVGRWEGYRGRAYNDAASHATIGYGHLLHYGACTRLDKLLWWPRPYALLRLRRDAQVHARAVQTRFPHLTRQCQVDALVSFSFNCGDGALDGAVGRAVRTGDVSRVRDALLLWDRANGRELPGLKERRRAEGWLYSGVWTEV